MRGFMVMVPEALPAVVSVHYPCFFFHLTVNGRNR